jgi:hypothetical protein
MSALYDWGLHHRWDENYMPVSKQLLAHLIAVLHGHVARWEWSQGASDEAQEYYELMAATCTALGGAIAAEAANERHGGAREIVLLIQDFLEWVRADEHLDAVRTDPEVDGEVVEALKALHGPLRKRRRDDVAKLPPYPASSSGGPPAGAE